MHITITLNWSNKFHYFPNHEIQKSFPKYTLFYRYTYDCFRKESKLEFTLNFDEVNHLKTSKVYAHVINLNRLKKIIMEICNTIDNIKMFDFMN